jgi:hypothetical protein
MEGGTITGNTIIATDPAGCGVWVEAGAKFTMSGGTITGNVSNYGNTSTTTPADVQITHDAGTFTLSGNATIGALTLQANASRNASITLAGALTGTGNNITTLHLRGDAALATVRTYWLSKQVVKGATSPSYTPTASDIGKIGMGKFITNAVANDTNIGPSNTLSGTPLGVLK